MTLQVEINEADYGKVIQSMRTLEKSEESVLKTAVNNTAAKVQKLMAQKISERYAGKAAERSSILEASRMEKATTSSVKATVTISSPIHEVKDFHVTGLKVQSPYTKKGKWRTARPSGNVLKGGKKKFDEGFAVKFQSGHVAVVSSEHVAVVSRMPGVNADKFASKPSKPHYEKLRVWYSPSKATMAQNVYDAEEISDRLHEEIDKIMKKVLGG